MAKATRKAELAINAAFRSLGQGLRVEEIAAASGLSEEAVRAVLAYKPAAPVLSPYIDLGAKGWIYDPFIMRGGAHMLIVPA
jgi:hypothetical protein